MAIVVRHPRLKRCRTLARAVPLRIPHRAVCTSPLLSCSNRKAGREEGSGEQPYRHTNTNILVLVQIQCYFETTVPVSETSQLFPLPSVVRPIPSITKEMRARLGLTEGAAMSVGECTFVSAVLATSFFVCSMYLHMFGVPSLLPSNHPNAATSTKDGMLPFFLWLLTDISPFAFLLFHLLRSY